MNKKLNFVIIYDFLIEWYLMVVFGIITFANIMFVGKIKRK